MTVEGAVKYPATKAMMVTLAALLWISGCGGPPVETYPAGGKVTFPDGTPLSGGRVEFQEVQRKHNVSPRATIEPDGTFELGTFSEKDGAPVGEYRALVVPPIPNIDVDELESWSDYPEPIDKKFKDARTSGLQFTVTTDPDQNHFQIQVEPGNKS